MEKPDKENRPDKSDDKNKDNSPKSFSLEDVDHKHLSSEKKKGTGAVYEASDSFRDKQSTIGQSGKRVWVYPQKPKGKKHKARSIVSYILLAILFITPFIHINGHPLMMFNVPERKFIVFGSIFWPQDFIILALAFLSLVIFIVMFTAAFGRIWCGWACPQTIFMEMVFRKIEYWIEGNANKQRILAMQPWNKEKILKKGSKQLIFFAISFIIGNLFLSYIIGVKELYSIITDPPSQHIAGLTAMLVFTSLFYGVFAWFREQVCTFVCPYGRLQGVLLDKNSLVVAYDHKRGEPRGRFSRKRDENLGDCIDCKKCVQVCPTGIDIRNGTQLECINCTACMDACDEVMEKVGFPKKLIRYASENQIEAGKKFRFTGRMKFYTVILTILLSLIVFMLTTRSNVDSRILRAKGQTYTVTEDQKVSNLYTMKVINKTFNPVTVDLNIPNFDHEIEYIGRKKLEIPGNDVLDITFLLRIPQSQLELGTNEITIEVNKINGELLEKHTTNFSAPGIENGEKK